MIENNEIEIEKLGDLLPNKATLYEMFKELP